MSGAEGLNLARRPFVNARPVSRVATLLWLLGALLLAANVWLFWSYFSGSGEQRARLSRFEAEIERNRERSRQLETEVAGLDLARQNERVLFLNEKIAERTFSWSLLFDRLAEVLPRDVRLTRLTPATTAEQAKGGGTRRRTWRQRAGSSEVTLTIGGEAKSDEALDQLVNNLFDPPFDNPNLSHESKSEETGRISFDLQVGYFPGAAVPPAAAGAAGAAGAITVEEEPLPGQPGQPGQPTEPSSGQPGQPGGPLPGPPGQPSEAPPPPTGGAR